MGSLGRSVEPMGLSHLVSWLPLHGLNNFYSARSPIHPSASNLLCISASDFSLLRFKISPSVCVIDRQAAAHADLSFSLATCSHISLS